MWWLRSFLSASNQQEVPVHLPVVGTDVQAVDQDDGTNVFLGGEASYVLQSSPAVEPISGDPRPPFLHPPPAAQREWAELGAWPGWMPPAP